VSANAFVATLGDLGRRDHHDRQCPEAEASWLTRSDPDGWRELSDGWLIADQSAPRKQRHTAKRIHKRLRDEHGVEVSERQVRRYVRERRQQLGELVDEVFVPLCSEPGAEAELDWGEARAVIAGVPRKVHLFGMCVCFSGACFVRAHVRETQQAFLEGHVAALRSHYLYGSRFTRVGKEGAHEKGGVEGDVDRFRRTYLVPVPEVGSLAELNDLIAAACIANLGSLVETSWKPQPARNQSRAPPSEPPKPVFAAQIGIRSTRDMPRGVMVRKGSTVRARQRALAAAYGGERFEVRARLSSVVRGPVGHHLENRAVLVV
jgi:hypothetical protein